jgi:hypothetical protein
MLAILKKSLLDFLVAFVEFGSTGKKKKEIFCLKSKITNKSSLDN